MTEEWVQALDEVRLVLGGNTFGWTSSDEESFRILDAYVDFGGRFVDTADVYSAWVEGHQGGESEEVIGRWMARHGRGELMVGTKVSRHPQYPGLTRANVLAAADASLSRLRVDCIDVYYAHYDDPHTPIEETVQAFHELQTAGKIRWTGLSNYEGRRVAEWVAAADDLGFDRPVFLQPHYNLVRREPYERDLQPLAEAYDLAVLPYFALASGFLTGKYRTAEDLAASPRQRYAAPYFSPEGLDVVEELDRIATRHSVATSTVALAWLLHRPNVVAPIASARTVAQLTHLVSAGQLQLSAEETSVLDSRSARILPPPN
jgi:aryl-alcohol dehydrogenase (NADP+)